MTADSYISTQSLPDFTLWEKLSNKRMPCSFELELTARCNLNCRHCYINLPAEDRTARMSELDADQITRIAEEAVSLGAIWCLLSGGEPFLRRDFFDIFLALKKRGLLVSIFTNATLITDRHIKFFKQYPPRDIEVTVYGTTPATYEKITRKQGSFQAFRRGLDKLLNAGIPVTLKAMAMQSNLHELPEIFRFCKEYSYHPFRFDPFLHLRYDHDPMRNKAIVAERLSPEQIVALEKSEPSRLEGLKHAKLFHLDPDSVRPNDCRLFGCGIGKESFYISVNGLFSFCSTLKHPQCLYDLKNDKLKDAWEGLFYQVRQITSSRKEYLENCALCPIINLCRWCPAVAHLESGSLDRPINYFCKIAHLRENALNSNQSKDTLTLS